MTKDLPDAAQLPQNCLGIETSQQYCAVALRAGQKTLTKVVEGARQHASQLLPLIDQLLTEARLKPSELSLISFGHGPGSFTGVRIAASVAQGLGFAQGTPVIGVSSLAAMALSSASDSVRSQAEDVTALALIDARMNEYYAGVYRCSSGASVVVKEDALLTHDQACLWLRELESTAIVCGDGLTALRAKGYDIALETLPVSANIAASIIDLACNEFLHGNKADLPLPVYLRGQSAWKKSNQR